MVSIYPELRGTVGTNTTVFLSVFKWEARKGWDVLLRAYFSEFGPGDDVMLLLRTRPEASELEAFRRKFDCRAPPCQANATNATSRRAEGGGEQGAGPRNGGWLPRYLT